MLLKKKIDIQISHKNSEPVLFNLFDKLLTQGLTIFQTSSKMQTLPPFMRPHPPDK